MILITGASGFIGQHIVRALMAQGLPCRVYLPPWRQKRLPWDVNHESAPQIISGTILNEETLFQAVSGVHTIIHLENALWWGRLRDLERVEIAGTRQLVTAARSARVGRIVYLSQLGASPSSAYLLHRIKGQAEEIVRGSGLAYTILRPGIVYGPGDAFINHIAMMFSINPLVFAMPGEGEVVLHPLYIDDLVRAVMVSLESLDVLDRTIEFGGMETISLADLLQTVMRVTGMPRLILPLPPYLLRLITRVYNLLLPRTLMTPQWLDILATNRTAKLSNTYDYFGFQPRRLEDTLVTYLPRRRHLFNVLRYTLRRRPRGI
jgi:NADH dehydrogenase